MGLKGGIGRRQIDCRSWASRAASADARSTAALERQRGPGSAGSPGSRDRRQARERRFLSVRDERYGAREEDTEPEIRNSSIRDRTMKDASCPYRFLVRDERFPSRDRTRSRDRTVKDASCPYRFLVLRAGLDKARVRRGSAAERSDTHVHTPGLSGRRRWRTRCIRSRGALPSRASSQTAPPAPPR